MGSREQILDALKAKTRVAALPGPWRTRRVFEDPAGRFEASMQGLKGEVHRANSVSEAWKTVDALLDEFGAERVVVDADVLDEIVPAARWPKRSCHVVGKSDGDLRAFCAEADVGLTGVTAALVETGSLIVESGPGKSRLASLLPPVHIAMVPLSRLTTDLFTWSADRTGPIATNVTLISGPSKTADIEFTLTLGAHGPKRLIAVLYDDVTM